MSSLLSKLRTKYIIWKGERIHKQLIEFIEQNPQKKFLLDNLEFNNDNPENGLGLKIKFNIEFALTPEEYIKIMSNKEENFEIMQQLISDTLQNFLKGY